MPRTARLARLLAAGLVLVAAFVAVAEESGARYYESRLGKLAKAAAARLWDAAAKARSAQLFKFAREEARRVLELDPDNLQARQFLGYVKKGAEWEIDLAQSGRLPTENQQASPGPKLADAENSWRVLAAKADLDIAAMYAQLGDECAAKGYRAEAAKAYEQTLATDPDNAAAHKGLGHVKLGDGLWLSAEVGRAYEAARVAKPVVEPSRYDELFGATFAKAESEHFRLESPSPPATIAGWLDSCERAYAAYMGDLRLDVDREYFPRKPTFLAVESRDHWDAWINRMVSSARQGFSRALTSQWSRDERWACVLRRWDGEDEARRRDRLAHQTVHMLNFAVFGLPDGNWLDEALAYRYSYLVQNGFVASFCLAPTKSDYAHAGQERDWTDSSHWKALLRELAAKNEDPPLRLIVNKSAYELPVVCAVKAWSVVDFLVRRDRDGFAKMLRQVKTEKDPTGLLETTFGKDVEALDDEWRKWVAGAY